MGPMVACAEFRSAILEREDKAAIAHIRCILYGSLAFTGRGHATDRAVALGLLGFLPETIDAQEATSALSSLEIKKLLHIGELSPIRFDPALDIVIDYETEDLAHPNTLRLEALDQDGNLIAGQNYCSIGGGFILKAEDYLVFTEEGDQTIIDQSDNDIPYPFSSMAELLTICKQEKLSIAELANRNESSRASAKEVGDKLDGLLAAMDRSIERGLSATGELPGGLHVKRRASKIHENLQSGQGRNEVSPHAANDWLCAYAMAVNEENAAGNQIVTAPTNGAAGVVPAVLRYYRSHLALPEPPAEKLREFLLVAGVVGSIIKQRASISGAEVGCQGEVGSASAMAAAGLCAVLGGTNEQIENAAEIALEHHLGLTCDPVRGLVQVPCIERNGFGAIKAVTAASLALHGDGGHIMPLDNCIDAMRDTGREMNAKFKETSRGGLAVNLPEC